MGIYTKEEQFKLIEENTFYLTEIDNQYEDICLKAVKRDGLALQYVKEQTPEICLEALYQYGLTLVHVIEPTHMLCFYSFLAEYYLLSDNSIENSVNEFIKNKNKIENNIFCIIEYSNIIQNKKYVYFDINSLIYVKDFLLKENINNTYIFDDKFFNDEKSLELLKEFALSNNKLIIIDNGNIKGIHKKLANKIITKRELQRGSF